MSSQFYAISSSDRANIFQIRYVRYVNKILIPRTIFFHKFFQYTIRYIQYDFINFDSRYKQNIVLNVSNLCSIVTRVTLMDLSSLILRSQILTTFSSLPKYRVFLTFLPKQKKLPPLERINSFYLFIFQTRHEISRQ